MFGLGIRYLNGWAMAALGGADKSRAEWPPHPDRVFMALAAAYFETDELPAERTALEWLERLPPPALKASDASERVPVASYVPTNDAATARKVPESHKLAKLKEAGLALLPEHRVRQPRIFRVAVPSVPEVFLLWRADLPAEHRAAVAGLCQKVVRLGHCASLVQMWLAEWHTEAPPNPTWLPREGVTSHRLRVPVPGRLAALEATFNAKAVFEYAELQRCRGAAQGKNRKSIDVEIAKRFPEGEPVTRRPDAAPAIGYDKPVKSQPNVAGTVFDPALIVLRTRGHGLGLTSTLKITEALRALILQHSPKPVPEWLGGHDAEGRVSRKPHVALIPLPFIGHEYADARILGLALAVPHSLDPEKTRQCLGALLWDEAQGLPRSLKLFIGRWFECRAELENRESPPYNLRPETWTRASQLWASVTPVVFDRHADGIDRWRAAEQTVGAACGRIGLPRSCEIVARGGANTLTFY